MRDPRSLAGYYVFVYLISSCLLLLYTASGALSSIGVLLPWDRGGGAYPFLGTRIVGAVDVALDTLNKDILPQEHPLAVIYKDTRCDNIRGSGASVDLWLNNVSAFIGPPCSSPCRTVAYFAAYARTPMVSWFCAECVFTESESLPLLARVFPPFFRIARLGVSVLGHFDWSVASIIAPRDTMWETLAEEVFETMEDAEMDPIQPHLYEQPLNSTVAISILEEAKTISRSILLPWDHGRGAYPFLGTRVVGAVDVALDTLNEDVLPQEDTLGVIYKDTRCDNIRGSGASVDLWQRDVSALIGPPCSSPCRTVAYFAAYAETPMVSWFCAEFVFTESEGLSLFARVFPSFSRIARLGVSVLEHFDWSVASIIAPRNTMWETLAGEIFEKMADASMDPIQSLLYEQPLNSTVAISILEEARTKSRIIWLVVGGTSSLEEDEFIFMSAAYKLGMTSGDFVFLRIELFPDPGFEEPWTKDNTTGLTRTELQEAYNAMLLLTHRLPWDGIEPFLREVAMKTLVADVPFSTGHRNMSWLEPSIMSAFLHDAVLLFGLAYNHSLFNTGNSTGKTNISYEYFEDTENVYQGMTGPLVLDSTGDRLSDFTLFESTVSRAFYEVGTISGLDLTLELLDNITIEWPGTDVPLDVPLCGFNNELCLDVRITIAIAISVFVALVLTISVSSATVRYRKFMNRTDWLIEWDQLTLMSNKGASATQYIRSSHRLNSGHFSRHSLIVGSIDDVKTKDDLPSFALATLNSQTVVLRKGKLESLVLNKETKRELKEMRWLVQDNINRFYGICILPAPDNCFYHTSELCSKGTLKSVLAKDDFNLDLSFKMSFIQDLTKGMQYLHNSEIKSHGLLCSAHCYIDSRWVLKISGFGTLSFQLFKNKAIDTAEPEARFANMVWTSPELLRQELPVKGSPKGDVYSFGIMIHEIMTRTVPYSNFQISSSKVIIRRVMKREEPPFRPDTGQEEVLTKGSIVSELVDLKKLCWEELPEHRPDYTSIRQRLRAMQKGHQSLNIMDNMLSKMEKYTENLEKVVESRTGQLLEEKKKTDALLYRMLPQMVADELKKGHTFPGEFFDEVTIYFSDIVRFTDLSAASSPMQVVDLLNDLYTCFDAVIEKFDVYKVETIGDAYMVVSGLPNRNGQQHAAEIAGMSLDIRNAVTTFKVRHKPDHHLQIRIGMNSGPVCAGVVGLTMPRFCLFGDTVNTASRMESNSLAQKIHVSASAASLLSHLGGYCLEYRGGLLVKGKGNMHTFWLHGRLEDCTDHENHNMMAGKKLSTETLASFDSLLSPSVNGAVKTENGERTDANYNSVPQSSPEESPIVGEGDNNTSAVTSQDSGVVENNDDVEHDNDQEINLPGTVQIDPALGVNNNLRGSPSKKHHRTNSRQNSKNSSRESHHQRDDNTHGQSDTSLNSGDLSPNVNRSRKLNQLLGQKAFQSFEEASKVLIEGHRSESRQSNKQVHTLDPDSHSHMNGSSVSIRSLGKMSASFDNHGYSPSTPRRNKVSPRSSHGDIPLSAPRINIDTF